MSTGPDKQQVMEEMGACIKRLKFSWTELQYVIGRARTRIKDPWDTHKLAEKLGISPETLVAYEAILVQQAAAANPILHALTNQRAQEVETKVAEAIVAEGKRRVGLVDKLADDWIDPTKYPRMPRKDESQ